MNNCVFCKMINENGLNHILIENIHAIGICDNYFREGHCTVILKKHKKSISELTQEEYLDVFELITKISKALEKKYSTEKTYLLAISDQVEHIHFHLITKHKDKCSMGVYCFGKLFESEGKIKTSKNDLNKLTNEIKNLITL